MKQHWKSTNRFGRVQKNWWFWTVVLEKTLERSLTMWQCMAIRPVHPKGKQHWILIERTDSEAEAPVLWPPDSNICWIIKKTREFQKKKKTSISALLTMSKTLTVWITTNWKILEEMGIPDHLTCFLRNLYSG